MKTAIRECTPDDLPHIVDYFVGADPEYLRGMGAEQSRLPDRAEWIQGLTDELVRPLETRARYYVIWEVDGRAIGHSNLTDIEFGVVANMHLHIWTPEDRRTGAGRHLAAASIDRYFERYELQTLLCEPFAENPAPNRTLPRLGFEFVETYHGIPGAICFPQAINRWQMTRARWAAIRRTSTARP